MGVIYETSGGFPPGTESAERRSVLFVDDEMDLRDILEMDFQTRGYHTYAVSNGLEALDLMRSRAVSVVVTDVRMPRFSGIELLDRLKATNVDKPAVVLISAYNDISPREAYDRGAEGVFMKPFRLADLADSVARLVLPMPQRWRAVRGEVSGPKVELRLPNVDAARQEGLLTLGRGGMAIAQEGKLPAVGEWLRFAAVFDAGPIKRLAGTGVMRWVTFQRRSSARPMCGVEFDYLEPESAKELLAWLSAHRVEPYIPGL